MYLSLHIELFKFNSKTVYMWFSDTLIYAPSCYTFLESRCTHKKNNFGFKLFRCGSVASRNLGLALCVEVCHHSPTHAEIYNIQQAEMMNQTDKICAVYRRELSTYLSTMWAWIVLYCSSQWALFLRTLKLWRCKGSLTVSWKNQGKSGVGGAHSRTKIHFFTCTLDKGLFCTLIQFRFK